MTDSLSGKRLAITHLVLSLLIVAAVVCLVFTGTSPLIVFAVSLILACSSTIIFYAVAPKRVSEQAANAALDKDLSITTAVESQRRFSVRVSHELRTPLTIIKGENQVLLARKRSVDEYEAQIISNLEEVEKMEGIIEDLLTFSKYETGELDIPRHDIWLDEVAAGVVKDLTPVADEKQIRLSTNTEHLCVVGDYKSLERMVCKLVENAIQYTGAGGQVYLRLFREGKKAILEVEDTGIGIPEIEQGYVFERFYRGESAKGLRSSGCGVGLSLAKIIAGFHGAEIFLESEVGRGTTFRVVFDL